MELGDRLREARERYGISQAQAANAIGVSRSAYSMYEITERDPDSSVLKELARLYGVSADWLLGRTNDPTPPEEQGPLSPDALLERAGALLCAIPGIKRADVDEVLNYLNTKRRLNLLAAERQPEE